MADEDDGIGLATAIAVLRDELLVARASGAGSDIQLPVESLVVELKVVATRKADGRAGFKVPIVNAEIGASAAWAEEVTQTVTVTFGGPIDCSGVPVKVANTSDDLKA